MTSRERSPKKNVITVRLTDQQLEILRNYVKQKGLSSEGTGIRKMIDGAADWVSKSMSAGELVAHRLSRIEGKIEVLESRLDRQDREPSPTTNNNSTTEPTTSSTVNDQTSKHHRVVPTGRTHVSVQHMSGDDPVTDVNDEGDEPMGSVDANGRTRVALPESKFSSDGDNLGYKSVSND